MASVPFEPASTYCRRLGKQKFLYIQSASSPPFRQLLLFAPECLSDMEMKAEKLNKKGRSLIQQMDSIPYIFLACLETAVFSIYVLPCKYDWEPLGGEY